MGPRDPRGWIDQELDRALRQHVVGLVIAFVLERLLGWRAAIQLVRELELAASRNRVDRIFFVAEVVAAEDPLRPAPERLSGAIGTYECTRCLRDELGVISGLGGDFLEHGHEGGE